MALLKCKMCGGDLNVTETDAVIQCEYCGTRQTVPNVDNEKKLNLFNRANRLRMASEFDKSANIYESIIAEFPEEAEAYWGLCLCNYGIEYVDDPATARKIPTCHRASFESLQKDENFGLALEYADLVAQKIYRDEAREIDRIMGEILSLSKNEKPYDVFICYKETDDLGGRTPDSVLAQDIYDALTAKGLKVFFSKITLEDKLGRQYEPYIFAALNSAKIMLCVGTKYEYFHAVWVKNEWSRFLKLTAKDKTKMLIPCYKDIDAYDMPDEFKSLQGQDMAKLGAIQDLVRGVEKIVGVSANKDEAATKKIVEKVIVNQTAGGPNVETLLKRGFIALEDGDFNGARVHFDKVLDMNAECAEAYLGLAMAEERVCTLNVNVFNLQNKNLLRAKQFADSEVMKKISELERNVKEEIRRKEALRLIKEREAEEQRRRIEEERIRKEKEAEEAKRQHIQKLAPIRERNKKASQMIAAGFSHTVGLKSNGTVVATRYIGKYSLGQCDVSGWTDIVAVSAGSSHNVGLKSDGTVVAVGENNEGQCNVSSWSDIVAVSAGDYHTVGLKSDGTVVAVGRNDHGQCYVSSWSDIVAVSAGDSHTKGLKSDGTVVAVGDNYDVEGWIDIVAVSAGVFHTVGLKSDGTVVAVGDNDYGQCDVSLWSDIVAVSAGGWHTVGLKSDGTVVAIGKNYDGRCYVSSWSDIVAVSAGKFHTVGLKSDGTVVAVGDNGLGKCDISAWKLFDDFENLEEERKIKTAETKRVVGQRIAEEKRKEAQRRIVEQRAYFRSQNLCQYCGCGTFKGLFTKKCTNCGAEKDY